MSKQHYKETGSSVINVTLDSSLGIDWNVYEVRLHLSTGSATGAESFAANILSSGDTASVFNAKICSQLMTSVQDYVFRPDAPVHLKHNDKLHCAWLNDASSYKTWGLEIVWDYF
jgi:hypothetical protein